MSDSSKYSNYLTHEESQTELSHSDNNHSNLNKDFYDHNHSHKHNHGSDLRKVNANVLLVCFIATLFFSLVEGIGGYLTHSIALQSDALHMLTDAAGLLIAYFANRISRKPATINLTFGYGKAEAVGALINCIFTILLTIALLIEVIQRFFIPVEVHGFGLFVLALIGFIVNGIIALVLLKHAQSLNTKAALIHSLGDLFASLVAIIAGVIIYFTNFWLIDPILSLIIIVLLIISNYNLIKKSIIVLMAGVPEYLNYEIVGKDLEAIQGIIGVHDLHIWYMSANKAALSAHIVIEQPYLWQNILLECQKMLLEKHKIDHITLQYEFDRRHFEMNYCEIK
ncbi:MAG TPA: cation diffusion facilitator family transporter [Burkholderiales bacterium]|nr:cation diffusion facilitator family transporter [Burkholderiales bacterium]